MYDDWLIEIAKRFQGKFDQMRAVHSFEYGDEFEIALCEVLRTILPRRAGVCRGYVVAQDDSVAGDDVVVFDAARFPLLRALGDDLSRSERIPAEAVLAYIEAKHTLELHGNGGQSLSRAVGQVTAVKRLVRTPLEHRNIVSGLDLGPQVKGPPTYPAIKNPWYTAIWCRRSSWAVGGPRIITPQFTGSVAAGLLPDVIATDEGCLLPCLVRRSEGVPPRMEVRPFLCESTEYVWSDVKEVGLGIAAVHLLWAIEWIVLSDVPWNAMMTERVRESNLTWWPPRTSGGA